MTRAGRLRKHWLPVWLMLLSLVGAGQLLPALHFIFVSHRICAEHGETLHAELAPSSADPPGHAAGETLEARVQSAPALPHHEHEHCSLLGLARSAAAAFAPAPCIGALPPLGTQLCGVAERRAHVDIALLMYAPKLAPPV